MNLPLFERNAMKFVMIPQRIKSILVEAQRTKQM